MKNGTESHRPDRGPRHPILDVLREQGRRQSWLADRIGHSHEYTNRVLNGAHPAPLAFREKCARVLELPVSDLFLPASDAPPATDDTQAVA